MTVTFPLLERAGRLGNQLFQVAATVAIARQTNDAVRLSPHWTYRPWFCCPDEWFGRGNGTPAWERPEAAHLGKAAMYLQDVSLFASIGDEIRAAFSLSPKAEQLVYEDYLNTDYAPYLADKNALAVHVRRGDLLTCEPGFHPVLTVEAPDYYRIALQAVDPLEVRTVWVFTDDPAWAREHMAEVCQRDVNVVESSPPRSHLPKEYRKQPATDWIDLHLLSLADTLILSNSTYAWWAAWLSNASTVLYPEVWFGPKLYYIDTELAFTGLPWRKVPC